MAVYHKDTEPLYHSFMYSFVSLLSGIYPLRAIHSWHVTLYVTREYLIVINQRLCTSWVVRRVRVSLVNGASSLGGERVRCSVGFGGVEISLKLDIYVTERSQW